MFFRVVPSCATSHIIAKDPLAFINDFLGGSDAQLVELIRREREDDIGMLLYLKT